ncbi:MAG: alpha-amylase family glycosyl hydrolase, partial [Spirochaetes bacterium]|nr:alpha-amylase family glycosyl hydrolase [Spirochaetota bacterium]
MNNWKLSTGANLLDNGNISFKVWAPNCQSVSVEIIKKEKTITCPLLKEENGYFYLETNQAEVQDKYFYILNQEKKRPDPVSRSLPDTVHGPTKIINHKKYTWHDHEWQGIKQSDLIFYELHVGTFSSSNSFAGIIEKLDYLKDLGITCLELMPVSRFPGKRNWGYDGVSPYAVQNSYGDYDGLKELIDTCHQKQLAFCLDVVYNHLGPEGNYLHDFGPYFTDHYKTPWGWALNYDGYDCEPVREYMLNNALYWIHEFHVDVLRLDAVHSIFDFGAYHFLAELADKINLQNRDLLHAPILIAESDLNDVKIIQPKDSGGYTIHGQWSDDFHHSLHSLKKKKKNGYYSDFGSLQQFCKALQ